MNNRKYGVATHLYKPIVKRGVVDFAVGADWTPAGGDVKISKDGGAAANVTNLPTAITMGNTAMWDYSITATEMQANVINITVADSATKVVEDQFHEIETYGRPFTLKFMMTDSTNHAPVTGKTVTATVSADGGTSFASTTNSPAEDANGIYHLVVAAADVILGDDLVFRFTAAACDDTFERENFAR